MKNYTLTRSGDNGFNIGTIQTDNFKNLKKLIEKSCAAHFDLEISNVGLFEEDFKNERFLGGDKFFFYITVKDGDEKWREEIVISQTWIYKKFEPKIEIIDGLPLHNEFYKKKLKKKLIKFSDGFCFTDITEKAKEVFNSGLFQVFEINKDEETEHLIEKFEDLNKVLENGGILAIESGY